ncbi:HPP family protein [Bacillus sp. FJAT-45350]|uniref:HPP family protein n=1 Tax=Bacillus sp. FJAT-45350 TaxID=2011014 RepID=UPI00211C3C20|nr:HPP family protein [Bacillus sp. FJAT-45350]
MEVQKERQKDDTNLEMVRSLSHYINKMKGTNNPIKSFPITDSLISAGGGLIAMVIISLVAVFLGHPMVLGPIGASCLLVFVAYEGPFSQPRHVIGGHLLSTIAALTIWDLFGRSHVTIGITLAIVVLLMLLTNMMHPPAAASAIVAINTQIGWSFLFTIFLCAILAVIVSILYNNLFKNRSYPQRWI